MYKKLFIIFIIILSLHGTAIATEFTDINDNWSKGNISRLIENRVIDGYHDGTFKPDNNITINEFIKLITVASNKRLIMKGNPWPDWYVETAKVYDLISDYDDYDRPITRYEVVDIISKYIDLKDAKKSNNKFKDLKLKYKEKILKLNYLKIINGYEDNTFKGEDNITRAEASALICRTIDAKNELLIKRKFDIDEVLTNINKKASYDSFFKNRYEIKNNKIVIYDEGRYAKLDGYNFIENNITSKQIINLIKSLITEDRYVYFGYVPDNMIVNQLIVSFGKREGYIYNGAEIFSYTFYEDKLYEDKYFMKVTTGAMWIESYKYNSGDVIDKLNYEKLKKSLQVLFEKDIADKFSNYIKEKVIEKYSDNYNGLNESINFKNYKVDVKAKKTGYIDFYIIKN